MNRATAVGVVAMGLALTACAARAVPPAQPTTTSSYFDGEGSPDRASGGIRHIPVTTPKGTFWVWTKRVGNNPRIKVLLLHGGPGATHEYFEAFDGYFPGAGIEYYYYDQSGSAYSEPLGDDVLASFLNIGHYVDEVEQVRLALGLDETNFYLLGHSWGGILAMEYALAHPEHLRALIVSNMMSSIPAYVAYAQQALMPQLPAEVLQELLALEAAKDYDNPRYGELLLYYYVEHILRMPPESWPDPVIRAFGHVNRKVYVPMQGPSEMSASGVLATWDRSKDLGKIGVPTLVIGAEHDTMDPKHMEWMATQFPRGRYLYCPGGGHMAMYDAQAVYMRGVIDFILDVDAGRFP